MSVGACEPVRIDVLTLEAHEAAQLFPLMSDEEIRGLANDIKVNGQRRPVSIWRDRDHDRWVMLDGRNRALACRLLGIEPRYSIWEGDPVAFVVSENLQRLHMNESQRAMVAARLSTMKSGARTDLASIEARSQTDAAKRLNVSRAQVQRARAVIDSGSADLVRAVETGAVAVSAAAKIAALPVSDQGPALDDAISSKVNPRSATARRREADVVRLHAEGRNGVEIAETLGIHETSVSAIKTRVGIRTEGKKLAQQIERAIVALAGVSDQVEVLVQRLETHDPEMSRE